MRPMPLVEVPLERSAELLAAVGLDLIDLKRELGQNVVDEGYRVFWSLRG